MPTETAQQPTYLEAVGAALDAEMERDPDVFIIGEDVGQFGGAFKVTKGFLDKFGPRRVVDTPIAETGFTGLAAGAALVGLRPVVEFQFADFISCAFDPIINVMARHHWRTGDPMPVTMRAPFGARLRAGPTHSQSVESYFAHVPGLKIVMPGTPEDAAGLLVSAIRDNNPVLYLENKYLYRRLRAAGPLSLEPIPLGRANVVREGTSVTLITYSAGVTQGLEIAAEHDHVEVGRGGHAVATFRSVSAIRAGCGTTASSSGGLVGVGVFFAPIRVTGWSRCQKHSSWITDAISAPYPSRCAASCSTTAREVFRTDAVIVSTSSGTSVRTSTTSTEMPSLSSSAAISRPCDTHAE